MTAWLPGMRCVCVKRFRRTPEHGERLPVVGNVYTVRDIEPPPDFIDAGVFLRFEEIINPIIDYGLAVREASFHSESFRPLSETRLDVFRNMLAPNPTDRVPA